MNTLETLISAIDMRTSISFEYNKEGKVKGERIGNTYAIYILTAKNTGVKSTKVDIVQTDGVSDTKDTKPFPDFRMFNIEDLSNVKLFGVKESYAPPFDSKYKPESERYKDVIAKV